ncbi:Protein disulfide-isomerase [Fusarium oxysporum f. sp. albedinis]|nr:Protein disulfide-isomerase [Fusarium oxysporum f. sp. albedinis]
MFIRDTNTPGLGNDGLFWSIIPAKIYGVHLAPLENCNACNLSRGGERAIVSTSKYPGLCWPHLNLQTNNNTFDTKSLFTISPVMNFHFANPRDEQKQSLFFRLPREIHADIITICVPTSWQRFNKYHQDEDQKPLRLIKAERCLPVLFSTCQEMLARAPYDISTQA